MSVLGTDWVLCTSQWQVLVADWYTLASVLPGMCTFSVSGNYTQNQEVVRVGASGGSSKIMKATWRYYYSIVLLFEFIQNLCKVVHCVLPHHQVLTDGRIALFQNLTLLGTVLAFGADVDTTVAGTVFYQQSTDPSPVQGLLDLVASVDSRFGGTFTSVFSVTWSGVGYFDQNSSPVSTQ